MKNKHYIYWPDVIIAVLITAIMTSAIYFAIFHNNGMCIPELEPVAAAVEIEEAEPERQYFDVPLDEDLQDYIFEVCETYSIDPAVIVSMIERESTFRNDVKGDGGESYGLMQIKAKWHKERMERLGVTDLLDPRQNVLVGTDFLHELLGQGKGMVWALMAYNGGPSYANDLYRQGKASRYAIEIMAASNRRSFEGEYTYGV